MKHKRPITIQEKMDCSAMKFQHGITNFTLDGVTVDSDFIFMNYDRRGNILIGMDILSKWDIHMGISRYNGKNVFIGCPLHDMSEDYFDALNKHFDL